MEWKTLIFLRVKYFKAVIREDFYLKNKIASKKSNFFDTLLKSLKLLIFSFLLVEKNKIKELNLFLIDFY